MLFLLLRGLFSSFSKGGCSLVAELGLLVAVTHLGAEHTLWGARAASCGSWTLEHRLGS